MLALVTPTHSPVTAHYWLRLKDSAENYSQSTQVFLFLLRCKNTSQAVLLQPRRNQRMRSVFITKSARFNKAVTLEVTMGVTMGVTKI